MRKAWREGRRCPCLLAAGMLVAAGTSCFAQTRGALTSELMWLQQEEVIVTSDRAPRRVETIPSNITVITAEQIERSGARQVPDVLRYYAGVDVHDLYGNSRQARVDVRGFGLNADANALVLVDGRRVNGVTLYNTDWTTVPLERVARIEIVRGGHSVLYGSQAVSGVINIITRRGTVEKQLEGGLDLQRWGYRKPFVNFSGTALVADGSLTYHLNASRTDHEGYRANSEMALTTGGLSLGFQRGPFSLDLSAGTKDDRHGTPGGIPASAPPRSTNTPDNFKNTEDGYLHLVPTLRLGTADRVQVGVDYRKVKDFSHNSFRGMAFDISDRVTQLKLSPQYVSERKFRGMTNRLTIGLDHLRSEIDRVSTSGNMVNSSTAKAAYVTDTLSLLDDVLYLDGGYRREKVDFEFRDAATSAGSVSVSAWKAGATWNYREGSKVFLVLDRSFRTQLLDETGAPSPLLQPQTSRQVQLGVAHRFDKATELRATYFDLRTSGEIDFSTVVFANANGEPVRRRGLELEGSAALGSRANGFFSFTQLDANRSAGPFAGKQVPLTADHKGSIGLNFTPAQNWFIDGKVRWVNGKIIGGDVANTVAWKDSHRVADLGVSFKDRRFTIGAGVLNLTNEKYAEFGYEGGRSFNVWPLAERTYYLKLTVHHVF